MRQTHRKLSILRCRNRVELSSHSLHFAMAFFLTWNLLTSINFSRPTGMEKRIHAVNYGNAFNHVYGICRYSFPFIQKLKSSLSMQINHGQKLHHVQCALALLKPFGWRWISRRGFWAGNAAIQLRMSYLKGYQIHHYLAFNWNISSISYSPSICSANCKYHCFVSFLWVCLACKLPTTINNHDAHCAHHEYASASGFLLK